ncbi:unnamed protein product [Discosporangium mesarthrocarpum]
MCAPQASDVASASPKPKKAPRGHGGMGKMDPNSFVQGDMRKAAMRLHTRDQAPKEGEKQNKGKKFSEWVPSRWSSCVSCRFACSPLGITVTYAWCGQSMCVYWRKPAA